MVMHGLAWYVVNAGTKKKMDWHNNMRHESVRHGAILYIRHAFAPTSIDESFFPQTTILGSGL